MISRVLTLAGVAALLVSAPGVGRAEVAGGALAGPRSAPERAALVAVDEAAPVLRLALNEGPAPAGDVVTDVRNSGRASVEAVVVAGDGGRAVRVAGRNGSWGVRFPAFSGEANPPRAVLRVTGTAPGDALRPGGRDFRFAAAWKLDARSGGTDADNGNNLIQRGLAGDEGQFKLEIDRRVPTCAVKGDQGVVVVRAEPVRPEVWYRARCLREGNSVSVSVWELTRDGVIDFDSTTERGPIGSVTFDEATPLSVGGKLTSGGNLVGGSGDQFNGVVDNVVYDTID